MTGHFNLLHRVLFALRVGVSIIPQRGDKSLIGIFLSFTLYTRVKVEFERERVGDKAFGYLFWLLILFCNGTCSLVMFSVSWHKKGII